MHRCYCGHSTGGSSSILKSKKPVGRGQQEQRRSGRSDLQSLTSSSRQSAYPTQFVKLATPKSKVELGLGHSQSELARIFSRRNSAATTLSHCSSCCSSHGCAPQQRQRDNRVKVLSWDTGDNRSTSSGYANDSYCEHTDNRRLYEQRACVASRMATQGQVQGQEQCRSSDASSPAPNSESNNNHEMQRLLLLQQFRLLNASDCFSIQRQDELRLQNAYNKLMNAATIKLEKNTANEQWQRSTTGTTPYALRQRMLQLRLNEERANGRGTGALCAPLESSCALRYN